MNLRPYELSSKSYQNVFANKIAEGNALVEVFEGGRRKCYKIISENSTEIRELFFVNKLNNIYVGNLKQKNFSTFLIRFKKELVKNIIFKNLYDLRVDFKGKARDKNKKMWDTLKVGDYFYGYDIKSAYWQMLYKLGYINEKFFKDYLELEDYKHAKRLCVSFLGRTAMSVNHSTKEEVVCDTTAFEVVYENVRNEMYKHIADAVKITNGEWISYNIDGLYTKKDMRELSNFFSENGIVVKGTLCRKVNKYEYYAGSKLTKF